MKSMNEVLKVGIAVIIPEPARPRAARGCSMMCTYPAGCPPWFIALTRLCAKVRQYPAFSHSGGPRPGITQGPSL